MRVQKLLSALTAICLASTAVITMPMTQVTAADETLTFDIQCAGANTVTLSTDALTEGNVEMPISIYVTENPGVNAISMKLQINDGEEAEDGTLNNYGFTMAEGTFATPYCFDSANEGDSAMALSSVFTSERMNISWLYSADQTVNADAYAEAGTAAWDSSVSWVYDYAFVTANLVIPQDTPAGTYVLDIRREKYVNSLSTENYVFYSQTLCKGAGVEGGLAYDSVPLTIVIEDAGDTTTTTTTTTTTDTTTTIATTTTTASETVDTTQYTTTTGGLDTTTSSTTTTVRVPAVTVPAEVLPDGSDPYADLLAGDAFTFIYGNVSGAPGSTVQMPIYVYNDPGTAGMQFYIDYDSALTPTAIKQGMAYLISMQCNPNSTPLAVLWATGDGTNKVAVDGNVFVYLEFTIPEDAEIGTTYQVGTSAGMNEDTPTEVCDTDGIALDFVSVGGTVTVVADEESAPVALNYTEYSFGATGDTVVLELLNATEGEIAWFTSNPEIASVTACGSIAQVTATGSGNCQIVATYNGETYVCNIRGGLFGDVDANGVISSEDAMLTLKEYVLGILGGGMMTDSERMTADVTGDSEVDSTDAMLILKYYVQVNIIGRNVTWYELTGNPNAPGAP